MGPGAKEIGKPACRPKIWYWTVVDCDGEDRFIARIPDLDDVRSEELDRAMLPVEVGRAAA